MNKLTGSLRLRLAIASFLASYTPVLVLLLTFSASTSEETFVGPAPVDATLEIVADDAVSWAPILATAALLVPVAAVFAWWWSGRAVRPIEHALVTQERLIEEASHELRTPLAVLANNADVLLDHPNPSIHDFRQGLVRSRSAARRITTTLDALLVDARGRARTIVRDAADITTIAARAVDAVEVLARSVRVTLRVVPAPNAPARVDRDSVERAIINLLTNAIHASPPGSQVMIKVLPADNHVDVLVTDEGPGVPEPDQADIFERYWQADDDQVGTGIGLSVARQIALAHGGEITLRSPVSNNRGSEFRLRVMA